VAHVDSNVKKIATLFRVIEGSMASQAISAKVKKFAPYVIVVLTKCAP
jgi:hypothetical protein